MTIRLDMPRMRLGSQDTGFTTQVMAVLRFDSRSIWNAGSGDGPPKAHWRVSEITVRTLQPRGTAAL